MARLPLLVACAAAALAATAPAAAQERPPQRPETAREAGLRFLTWPGRTTQPHTEAARSERPRAPARRRAAQPEQPAPETPARPDPEPTVRVAATPPVVRAQEPPTPESPTAEPPGQVRYYSVHREAGRRPDPLPERVLTPEETMVALAAPAQPSLAERDRTANAEDALALLRDLPPDQLAQILERRP